MGRGRTTAENVRVPCGSADDPELFVLLGDPDAGSLRILKRAG